MTALRPAPAPIEYTLQAVHPAAHLFEVSVLVDAPDPAGQIFSLPAWIPGSYMIREFARNIVSLRAEVLRLEGRRAVVLTKLDKHSWQLPAGLIGPVSLTYTVYAWDLSVRSAHLDESHGFFNGSSVFLAVQGREDGPQRVLILPPCGLEEAGWRVATSLPEAAGEPGAASRHGFGKYRAGSYAELIDHPVEMGTFSLFEFEAGGVAHEVAITGRHDCDGARLVADLAPICAWQIALFGQPAPVARYVFLVTAVGEGYGGLEHRASTALLCSRNDLPHAGSTTQDEAYRQFLGLCSHEYFHTWNVKRIKPAAFAPYDLTRENYTRLLWAFEGFTSYYDDLALLKSGRIGAADYLGLVARTISTVHKGSGRHKQSLAESSFDAWTKYYRQDENSPNAIVSYYAKGALVALLLDLRLRVESDGALSLDDLMRALWRDCGEGSAGVAEDGLYAHAAALGGAALGRWLQALVEGTAELPLEAWLRRVGVSLAWTPAAAAPSLGARSVAEGEALKLANVYDGGAAQAAGLSAGDCLVALDGLKLTAASLDKALARHRAGDRVEVHAFRRDELRVFSVELQAAAPDKATLSLAPRCSAAAKRLRAGWLDA